MNLVQHAKQELEILSKYSEKSGGNILYDFHNGLIALCEDMQNSGHSGASARFAISAIASAAKKLLSFEPLSPITGEDSEWDDMSEYSNKPTWQNIRLSSVFKNKGNEA